MTVQGASLADPLNFGGFRVSQERGETVIVVLCPAGQLRTSPLWPQLSRETTESTAAAGAETEDRERKPNIMSTHALIYSHTTKNRHNIKSNDVM